MRLLCFVASSSMKQTTFLWSFVETSVSLKIFSPAEPAPTTDPQLSKKIVDTTVNVFTNEVKETLNINNITTVDDAKLQTSPISPSVPKNIVIGGLVGAILSIGIIFIRFMLDNRLHTKEDVEKYLEIPNLGVIPYFED